MFKKTSAITRNLGKCLTAATTTAVVIGAIAGAMATAKINNDIDTATFLSMGDKDLTKQIVKNSFANEFSTEISAIYSSILSGENINFEQVTDKLIDKSNNEYWHNISTGLAYSNFKTEKIDEVFETLYFKRGVVANISNEENMLEGIDLDKNQMYVKFLTNYTKCLEKINNGTGINNIIEGIISADKSMNLSDAKEAISKHQATLQREGVFIKNL